MSINIKKKNFIYTCHDVSTSASALWHCSCSAWVEDTGHRGFPSLSWNPIQSSSNIEILSAGARTSNDINCAYVYSTTQKRTEQQTPTLWLITVPSFRFGCTTCHQGISGIWRMIAQNYWKVWPFATNQSGTLTCDSLLPKTTQSTPAKNGNDNIM
jgi:hypothetical protein